MIEAPIPAIGLPPLRPAPPGLPDPSITPPTVAESGDPFSAVRVIDLLARLERGRPIRVADIAERLNASYLDWLFGAPVILSVKSTYRLSDHWTKTLSGVLNSARKMSAASRFSRPMSVGRGG